MSSAAPTLSTSRPVDAAGLLVIRRVAFYQNRRRAVSSGNEKNVPWNKIKKAKGRRWAVTARIWALCCRPTKKNRLQRNWARGSYKVTPARPMNRGRVFKQRARQIWIVRRLFSQIAWQTSTWLCLVDLSCWHRHTKAPGPPKKYVALYNIQYLVFHRSLPIALNGLFSDGRVPFGNLSCEKKRYVLEKILSNSLMTTKFRPEVLILIHKSPESSSRWPSWSQGFQEKKVEAINKSTKVNKRSKMASIYSRGE